jgi:hypothetical protein
MSDKTFKVVGITVHNGNAKVRFTDDLVRRVKQFTKGGATRCEFVELSTALTKMDALKHMLTLPEFASPSDQATINDAISDRSVQAKAKSKEVKVTATPSKPSVEAIKARIKSKQAATTDTATDVKTEVEQA